VGVASSVANEVTMRMTS